MIDMNGVTRFSLGVENKETGEIEYISIGTGDIELVGVDQSYDSDEVERLPLSFSCSFETSPLSQENLKLFMVDIEFDSFERIHGRPCYFTMFTESNYYNGFLTEA